MLNNYIRRYPKKKRPDDDAEATSSMQIRQKIHVTHYRILHFITFKHHLLANDQNGVCVCVCVCGWVGGWGGWGVGVAMYNEIHTPPKKKKKKKPGIL